MLSHKKYNELVLGMASLVPDKETLERLLELVRRSTNYSEDQKSYNVASYEKAKAKRQAGDQSWNDYQRQYHALNKDALNERRRARYNMNKHSKSVCS